MKVLAIGDINADIIMPFKIPKAGKQATVEDFQVHGGGSATNFALACAKLGAKSKLIGRVSDDMFGGFILRELKKQRVDIRDVIIPKCGKTGVTIALVKGKERSFLSYRGENAVFSAGDIDLNKVRADIVHISSFFLLEKLRPSYTKLARVARKNGAVTSFDTGWDPFGMWGKTKFLLKTLKSFDVFIPNDCEARAILGVHSGDDTWLARKFLKMGLKAIAIKKGEKGSFVADTHDSARVQPFRVKVVDSTGAGDVFDAAFLLAYLSGNSLANAAKFASAAAAISITGAGWSRYPSLAEVNKFLRARGINKVKITTKALKLGGARLNDV